MLMMVMMMIKVMPMMIIRFKKLQACLPRYSHPRRPYAAAAAAVLNPDNAKDDERTS